MIKIYTRDTCPECKVAKIYMDLLGKEYQTIEVNTPELIDEVVKISNGRKIPVIIKDDIVIVGFDKEKIKTL